MITSKEIEVEIKKALKQFGEYSYLDKGPDEVMDMDAICKRTEDMSAKQIADVLAEVRKDKEFGDRFVETILYNLQDRDGMDDLYSDRRVSDLY